MTILLINEFLLSFRLWFARSVHATRYGCISSDPSFLHYFCRCPITCDFFNSTETWKDSPVISKIEIVAVFPTDYLVFPWTSIIGDSLFLYTKQDWFYRRIINLTLIQIAHTQTTHDRYTSRSDLTLFLICSFLDEKQNQKLLPNHTQIRAGVIN